jgi:hypothetical protein
MGGACSVQRVDEKISVQNLEGRHHLEDMVTNGRIIILKWILGQC